MIRRIWDTLVYIFQRPIYLFLKRLLDLCGAVGLLIILAPLFYFIYYRLSKREGSPIFSRERCIGKNKKSFILYSFRTMTIPSQVIDTLPLTPMKQKWKEEHADIYMPDTETPPIYTSVGHWLNERKLDRLPQLWNVLKGDMSFIGPRPETIELAETYNRRQWARFSMKPGLICFAQVYGEKHMKRDAMLDLDSLYIRKCSLRTDAKIIFLIIGKQLKRWLGYTTVLKKD